MASADSMSDTMRKVVKVLDICPVDGKSLRSGPERGIHGVKYGFRLYHPECAEIARQSDAQRAERMAKADAFKRTELPTVYNTEGYVNWTERAFDRDFSLNWEDSPNVREQSTVEINRPRIRHDFGM